MTQQINLIDFTQQGGRDWVDGLVVMGAVGGCAALVLAHYLYEYQAWQAILRLPAPPEASTEPADAASDPLSLQLQLAEAELAGGERLQQAMAALVDAPRDTARRLQSLVAAMPATMWLKEVEFVGSRGLRISGAALHSEDLSHYSSRLSGTPAFAGLPVRTLTVDHKEKDKDREKDRARAREQAAQQPADGGAADPAPPQDDESDPLDALDYYNFELSSIDAKAEADTP